METGIFREDEVGMNEKDKGPVFDLDSEKVNEEAKATYEALKAKAESGDITAEEQAELDSLESMKDMIK